MAYLPADLPENWTQGQIISPNGTEVGLTEQHGYNYLMKQVNNTQETVNDVVNNMGNIISIEGSSKKAYLEIGKDGIVYIKEAGEAPPEAAVLHFTEAESEISAVVEGESYNVQNATTDNSKATENNYLFKIL